MYNTSQSATTPLSIFEKISQIPRGSGKEARIGAFVRGFSTALELDTTTDALGNIVISKPATPGMESHPTVALQVHMDMVQQQVKNLGFDFDNDPIELVCDGDWIRAKGTTLGADNGIGMAFALAVLSSNNLSHPPLEALFTVDEEVGMSGALAIQPEQLSADYLINLDMESDNALTIGCAGAVDIIVTADYQPVPLASDQVCYEIQIEGGNGGHSGLDIHKDRMNAIQVIGLLLSELSKSLPLTIIELSGGEAANVIPQNASAQIMLPKKDAETFGLLLTESFRQQVKAFKLEEPNIQIQVTEASNASELGFETGFQNDLLHALATIPNGVISMSREVTDLVETSNNLAMIAIARGKLEITCLARSCVESHKHKVLNAIECACTQLDATVYLENDAPGWEPRPESSLLTTMATAYREVTQTKPKIIAIHAGLETSILSYTFPNMEMISYGPNILSAHTTEERLQLSSVDKVWSVLTKTLATIPSK